MKLNLALKVETPLKSTVESSTNEKKFYQDWEYPNSCCLMIMDNHMQEYIYQAFLRLRMQKSFWMLLARNIQSFQRIRKMSYFMNIE